MSSTIYSSNSFSTSTIIRPQTLRNQRLSFILFSKRKSSFPVFFAAKKVNESRKEDTQKSDAPKFNPFSNLTKISDVKTLIPEVTQTSAALTFGNQRRKDPNTVFVAGADGQTGTRIVQFLLRKGFGVRAGVSDLASAQELARLAAKYKIISREESKRLNAVESTFKEGEAIAKAIGNAGKLVVTVGPSEKDGTSPVTTSDALQVIQGAKLAGVSHVAIIYDSRLPETQSTYNVLDGITFFFSNFFSRPKTLSLTDFLTKVVETKINYTVIKANLTEEYSEESSYNLKVSSEGNTDANDYKVTNSQIATLIAGVFSNVSVAENKVVEVATNPSAPSRSVNELFSAIREDGRKEAYAEALAKARAEEAKRETEGTLQEEEKEEEANNLNDVQETPEKEFITTNLVEEAQQKVQSAGSVVMKILNRRKDLGTQQEDETETSLNSPVTDIKDSNGAAFSWDKLRSQLQSTVSQFTEPPKTQLATVRGEAKARKLVPKKTIIKTPPKPKAKPAPQKSIAAKRDVEQKKETRKVFGGLFTQETIYIDDD